MTEAAQMPRLDVSLDVFLSKAWIERALKASGTLAAGDSITALETAPLVGGFMADTYRLTLEYSKSAKDAPRSIVAKFPSSNQSSRAAGEDFQSYAREVNFYKHLAPKLKMTLAKSYFSEIEEGTSNFCLMLEDLQPADMIDGQPCSLRRAHTAMRELALFHAGTWNGTELRKYDWIFDFSDLDYFASTKSLVVTGAQVLIKEFNQARAKGLAGAETIPDGYEKTLETFVSKLDRLPVVAGKRNISLTHCDYRLANLLFKGEDVSIAVDWQTYQLANPGFDTHYLLREVCPDGIQDPSVGALLDTYYHTLLENGVSNYSREQCDADSYFGALYLLYMYLVTSGGVGANGLPEPLLMKMLINVPKNLKNIKLLRSLDAL